MSAISAPSAGEGEQHVADDLVVDAGPSPEERGDERERGEQGKEPQPDLDRERHRQNRSEEHTSELKSLMRISYAVFCLKKKNTQRQQEHEIELNTINSN